jgi:very-short-patch-repair endonuclease
MDRRIFLEKARSIHGYKYEYVNLPNKILYSDYIDILYDGIVYRQRVIKHIMLGRCPEKDKMLRTNEEFINESKKIWGDKYDYSLVDYRGSGIKVKILYEGIVYEQTPSSHLRKWSPEKKMNIHSFLEKAKNKWGDKYDYSLVNFINAKTKVKIIYNGVVYEQTPSQHLKCSVENTKYNLGKTTEQFINESNIVHDFKYTYENTNYIKANLKLIINCDYHGEFSQRAQDHLNGVGCPTCCESKGEKLIAKFLKAHNIKFERQKIFNDCRNILPLPFDFYIEKFRMCIEFDGIQHFEPLKFFGGTDKFDKLQVNDKIKNNYCEDNYIDLVRIKYDQLDNIENYLNDVFKYKGFNNSSISKSC